MVNEFAPLSPKKDNDMDCFYRESSEKALVSESSDEDTTSSSLMPIPDTLDVMRNELKSTINNFGSMDYVPSPKPKDFALKNLDLDTNHPTEREVSIARKITSANLLLDDLLNTSNILPKNVKDKNPLVFVSKPVRQRSSPPPSETSDPSMSPTTSSSGNRCPIMPVTSFGFPQSTFECSRHPPIALPEPEKEPQEKNSAIVKDKKNSEKRRSSLLEKMVPLRLRSRKKRNTSVDESQQTQPSCPLPNSLHGYTPNETQGIPCSCLEQHPMGMTFGLPDCRVRNKCICPEASSGPVRSILRNMKDAKCGSDEPPESVKPAEDKNRQDPTPDLERKSTVRLVPVTVSQKGKERIDIYYFDHGNSAYYRTTDSNRARFTEYILERTDEYASKFWAEVFGTVTIAIAFVISFVLQLYRCVFTAVIRALTVGLIQIFSDYFFKPLLTVLFNGLIQPCLILGYNVATSTKDFCIPVCEICEFCAKDLAILFGSCRLVEIKQREGSSSPCHCRHNV